MPVIQCPNGKWRIGEGDCIYPTKEKAESAYRGYLAQKEQAFEGKKFDENELRRKLKEEKSK